MADKLPVAVVTGASSGIGAATARELAARGWSTVLVARTRAKLEAVAEEIRERGGTAAVEALDASDPDAVREMAERVRSEAGTPAAIVNSAGSGQWKFIEETDPRDAVQMMAVPYQAAFNVVQAFMADMLEKRRGVIVHVGSPASRLPWPGSTAYTTARWALRGLHEALVQDLRGTGVRSCHVVFGEVTSNYFENNPDSHEHIPKIAKLIPVMTPAKAGRVVASVVRRPRREVVRPIMLKLFYWMSAVMPGLSRWMLARTGRRH